MNTGACVNMRGNLCKVTAFDDRMKYKDSEHKPSQKELDTINELPVSKFEEFEDIDNPEKHRWFEIGSDKYGRTMFCPITKVRRTLTFAEFYQSATVD